jgi:hypothetical protein
VMIWLLAGAGVWLAGLLIVVALCNAAAWADRNGVPRSNVALPTLRVVRRHSPIDQNSVAAEDDRNARRATTAT